jgi:hypothetical protein
VWWLKAESHWRQTSGGLWFEDNQGKKFTRPHLNQQKLGVVVHICHHSCMGGINRKTSAQPYLGINARPYKKNN